MQNIFKLLFVSWSKLELKINFYLRPCLQFILHTCITCWLPSALLQHCRKQTSPTVGIIYSESDTPKLCGCGFDQIWLTALATWTNKLTTDTEILTQNSEMSTNRDVKWDNPNCWLTAIFAEPSEASSKVFVGSLNGIAYDEFSQLSEADNPTSTPTLHFIKLLALYLCTY